MREENKKGSNTLYAAIGVATLIVAIIGATFAYFSASATSTGDAITGQTDNDLASALSLTVEKVAFENANATSANLVPTNLEATLNGVNSAVTSKCVSNGYTGCHLYKITALSTKDLANASVRLTALNVDAKDTASWKYIIYKNDGSSNSATELVAGGASDFATFNTTYVGPDKNGFDMNANGAISANTPAYYYLMIYLANKADNVQNPSDKENEHSGTGTYNGTVSMDVLGGKVVATFSNTGN